MLAITTNTRGHIVACKRQLRPPRECLPVKIAGITPHPHEAWMVQMARNLTEVEERIESIRLPPQSPNCEHSSNPVLPRLF